MLFEGLWESFMRINAYIMLSEWRWVKASLASYYPFVERIVISYEENGRGFSGVPIDVERCLDSIKDCDPQKKFDFAPGSYYDANRDPMQSDTYQRQNALERAQNDADWVVQLDTDEVMCDAGEFFSCLQEADSKGFSALDYPARWFHYALGDFRYLERSARPWKLRATYPGPIAVRPNVELKVARQCDMPSFRVDFKSRSTDFSQPAAPVHRVVRPDQAIFHYSRVRSEEEMRYKARSSSHSHDMNWDPVVEHWLWEGRNPHLAALVSVLPRRFVHGDHQPLRVASAIPPPALR